MAIYKETDFARFIEILEKGQVEHWIEIAKAIGIDKNTISKWKELPEAVEARQRGIKHALEQMELSGKKDWRMWEAKLKMLDINPTTKHEVSGDSPIRLIIDKYGESGGVDDIPAATEAEDGSHKNSP